MKKYSLIPLLSAMVLVVIAVVAYFSAYSLVSSKSVEMASLASQIAQKTQATTNIAAAKAQLVALQSEEATVDQYFISSSDVVPFLEQLTATGKYLGANVQVLSVSATPGVPFGQLNLSLSITGPFNSVLRTLGAIEYGPQDTTVSNVTFNAPSSAEGTTNSNWTANAVYIIGAKTTPATSTVTPTATLITPPVIPVSTPATTTTATSIGTPLKAT